MKGIKIINNKFNFKEKGITLVALVITVIILLILAGVTLSTALGQNGLFQRAKYAGEKYKEAESQEQSALDDISKEIDKITIDYNDYVGAYVNNYETSNKECKISTDESGYTEEQVFKADDNMKWRIWDYDGTTIRLISDKPTSTPLYLSGAAGYNNGVWVVNEIARVCYANGERGVSALNLKRSDIQNVSTYDYTKYSHGDTSDDDIEEIEDGAVKFGSTGTFDTNNYYPEMWKNFDSKWNYNSENETSKQCLNWELENNYTNKNGTEKGNDKTEFKQTYYIHVYLNTYNDFINKNYYDILFSFPKEDFYWLATRCVGLRKTRCDFCLAATYLKDNIGGVSARGLYNSDQFEPSPNQKLRPIVSINLRTSGYSLEKIENSENGEISFKLNKNKS